MQLSLRKIHLENWKCYRLQEIQLHQTVEENISVIFGSNGFGKTSLLEAIRWCLYGSAAISKEDLRTRFNRVAIREDANVSLSIQLTFELGDSTFFISRSARRSIRGANVEIEIGEPDFYRNGRLETNPRIQIEALLPYACSEFYFFDGVEIKRYAQSVHSAEMRTAIERILGIPELRNLRDDARRAMTSIDSDLSKVQSSQPELQRVSDSLQDRLDEQQILLEQTRLASSELDASMQILDRLMQDAKQQESLRSQLESLERKERDIDRLNRDLDDLELSFSQAIRQAPVALLLPYIAEVSAELQRKSMSSARRSGATSQLRAILETSMCICGRQLDDESHQYIIATLNNERDQGQGDLRQSLAEESERNKLELLALMKPPDFNEILAKRDRIANDVDGLKQEVASLRADGLATSSTSVNELWRKVGDAEANVKTRREAVDSLQRDAASLDVTIQNLRRERENLASRYAETATLGSQASLARKLFEAAEELIVWRISETRHDIEKRTSEIHLAVTNKPSEYKGVTISDDDYSLRIVTATGDSLDPDTLSAGEKEALAFSFIAGLNLASGKSAPFIMDTPFGHLDVSHQANFIAALPKLPSQVTLLATDRDLPESLLDVLRPQIADVLTILRQGATEDASIIGGD